jgi:hypothetical protein
MTEPTSSPEQSEPATGPVYATPPSAPGATAPTAPPPGPPTGDYRPAPPPQQQPHTVYVPQPSSRLTKVAAWVGIAAGSLFIVAIVFGTGFFLGKEVGGGRDHHHQHGQDWQRQAQPMFPQGPRGDFQRGPNYAGPFGPGGPIIAIPAPPDGSGPGGNPGGPTTAPR